MIQNDSKKTKLITANNLVKMTWKFISNILPMLNNRNSYRHHSEILYVFTSQTDFILYNIYVISHKYCSVQFSTISVSMAESMPRVD